MIRSQNNKVKRTIFCDLVMFIKNFDPIGIRRPLAPETTMFYSEVMMIKNYSTYLNHRALAAHLIAHFFSKACFSPWLALFTPWVLLFRYHISRNIDSDFNLVIL